MATTDSQLTHVLVLNCGSSSIKYAVINTLDHTRVEGLAENLNSAEARIKHDDGSGDKQVIAIANANHQQALTHILQTLGEVHPDAVGHRVVHGGESFTQATLVDTDVIAAIEATSPLAPLHNPANLTGITAITQLYPSLPQVAVFDTAFHQTMPDYAYRYAVPNHLYQQHAVRRYGFHGTSHAYVTHRADQLVTATPSSPQPATGWISVHLGNGCSAAAVDNGKSKDTSMGLTPLEGLVMGTRSGDVDPSLHLYLHRTLPMSLEEIDVLLNKDSGLLGLSGLSNDMRTVEAAANDGNLEAQLAIEVFCYRVARYIASLTCALTQFTGIIFTGGIGENAAEIRRKILGHLRFFDIHVDVQQNQRLVGGEEGSFHQDDSRTQLWVIPTDEEARIAQETVMVLSQLDN